MWHNNCWFRLDPQSLCLFESMNIAILPLQYKVTISVCKSHEVICLLRPLSTLDFQPKVSFCLFQNVLTYEQTVNIIQPEVYYTKPVFEMAKMTFTHPCNPLCNGPWFIHKCSLIKNWSLYVTFAICGGCLFFVFLTLFPLCIYYYVQTGWEIITCDYWRPSLSKQVQPGACTYTYTPAPEVDE